jgi:hypothetical protein
VRFTAFVLQTGFSTGAFITMATASSSLMKEVLNRPSTEFGLYFLLFPAGLFVGTFLSSRVGARGATETMVLLGSILSVAAVTVQATFLLSGYVTPAAIFLPGFFQTLAQGIVRSSGGDGHRSAACGDGVRRLRICAKLLRRRICSALRSGRGWDAGADDPGNGAQFVSEPRRRRAAFFPRSANKFKNLRYKEGAVIIASLSGCATQIRGAFASCWIYRKKSLFISLGAWVHALLLAMSRGTKAQTGDTL